MRKVLDIKGQRFGSLVALEPFRSASGQWLWRCRCDCGSMCEAVAGKLRQGAKTSCGCGSNRGRKKSEHATTIEGARSLLTQDRSNNTSGHRGVSLDRETGRWAASITYQGKRRFLGRFERIEDAIAARHDAEQEILSSIGA